MKNILPLIFVLIFGLSVFSQETKPKNGSENPKTSKQKTNKKNSPLKLTSISSPAYTDSARKNNIQGKVVLMVEFKDTGEIGKIEIIKALPFGLTENAITAARKIKFEPEIKNGKPITVKQEVPYLFSIY